MRWTVIGVFGLGLAGCSPATVAQMLPAPNLYSDPTDYAHLWYQCHPGELEAKREQCAHLADPMRDQGCALAYGAMDTAPRPTTTSVIDGPLVLNPAQARCSRYGNGPPPPSYAGSPIDGGSGSAYGGPVPAATGPIYPGSAYRDQPASYGTSRPTGYDATSGVTAGSYGLPPPPPPAVSGS